MRTLITFSIPAEAGTKAIADGSFRKVFQAFIEENKPEALYFTTANGNRTAYAVVDIKEASQLPAICEPLFAAFHASIDVAPAMNVEDVLHGIRDSQNQ